MASEQINTINTNPFPQEVDPYDDDTLRRLAPEAFGSLGFDAVTAQLLVRGYFVPPNAAAALKIRIEAELTGHGASAAHHYQKRKKAGANGKPSLVRTRTASENEPGDRAPWDDEMSSIVVELHAKRISFKKISEHIPGKGVKACQEHYYRVVKEPRWKELHEVTRQKHDYSQSNNSEILGP